MLAVCIASMPAFGMAQVAPTTPADTPTATAGKLPADPGGKPTVIGGTVHNLDAIRDRFQLKVFGGGTVPIFYDPRTQLFRDGNKTSLLDLHENDRASVETTLDGTKVFALRIHTLSTTPQSECEGQVQSMSANGSLLTVRCGLSTDPVVLVLPSGVSVVRRSQLQGASDTPASLSDLVPNTLISTHMRPGNDGHGIADQIAILATPGSSAVFTGELTFLDVHAGRLGVTTDSGANYSITSDPAMLQSIQDLHTGARVKVVTTFEGSAYKAQQITPQ